MIQFARRVMQHLGLLARFSDDDVINASIEDKAREHHSVVEQLHETFYKRLRSNEALRRSIQIAKRRTNGFADFERLARREDGHRD